MENNLSLVKDKFKELPNNIEAEQAVIGSILVTNELFDELDNSETMTIQVDQYLEGGWNEYDYNISDHRPVAISFNLNSATIGDLNYDYSVDILDIVILINHILDIEAVELESADLNNDGVVNILDIVVLVNIIL